MAAEYSLQDESGAVAFVVERVEYPEPRRHLRRPRTASARRRFAKGGPILTARRIGCGTSTAFRPAYRLPELIEAIAAGRTILIVEGEG